MSDNKNPRDLILQHLIDNPNRTYQARVLKHELFKETHVDVIQKLMDDIIDFSRYQKTKIVTVYNSGTHIQASGLTSGFLEQGGFTIRDETIEKQKEKEEEKKNLESDKLKHETKLVKFNFKYRKLYLGIAIGSAIIALSSLLYSYNYNETKAKVLDIQSEEIELKMSQLNMLTDSIVDAKLKERLSGLDSIVQSEVTKQLKARQQIKKVKKTPFKKGENKK